MTIEADGELRIYGGPFLSEMLIACALYGRTAMFEAMIVLGMFIVWCHAERATWDGRTFAFTIQLPGSIDSLTITGTVEA